MEEVDPITLALLGTGTLLLLSLLAGKLGGRLGLPSLLLFLALGMLAGSDGPGGIDFEDYKLTQFVGTVALAFILFNGGLETNWKTTRPVLKAGISLASLGVLLTTALVGGVAHYLMGLPWVSALLLGAMVAPTDASAVFSVLKEQGLGLKGKIRPLLEFESGINDPTAVVLVVGLTELATHPERSALSLGPLFLEELLIGGVLGYALGRLSTLLLNRVALPLEGLYPVFTVALVSFTYGLTTLVHGSGFLAVYVAAVVLGNSEFIHKRSLRQFHEGVSYLFEVGMFLLLGLLVFPRQLPEVAVSALLIALTLVFVARPLATFVSLAFSPMPARHKLMVSWVGLRGAVPIILATFPLLAGVPGAQALFNVTFFMVLVSLLLQASSLPWVARRLGVDAPPEVSTRMPLEYNPVGNTSGLLELTVAPQSLGVGRRIMELHLPSEALIVLLRRRGEYLIPHGITRLEAGDELQIVGQTEALEQTERLIGMGES